MKTYAETKGRDVFDWHKHLSKSSWTEDELIYAESLSSGWITCACGNQCEVIPRGIYGVPRDDKLLNLGTEFYETIKSMMLFPSTRFPSTRLVLRDDAVIILRNIEKRSAELINNINYENENKN